MYLIAECGFGVQAELIERDREDSGLDRVRRTIDFGAGSACNIAARDRFTHDEEVR